MGSTFAGLPLRPIYDPSPDGLTLTLVTSDGKRHRAQVVGNDLLRGSVVIEFTAPHELTIEGWELSGRIAGITMPSKFVRQHVVLSKGETVTQQVELV